MAQGSIAQPHEQRPIIEGVLQALQAIHTIKGYNTQDAQNALLQQQQKQGETTFNEGEEQKQALMDPDSQESKLARADRSAAYDFAASKNYIPASTAKLLKQQMEGGEDENGDIKSPLSAFALQQTPDASLLQSLLKGQQSAEASSARMAGFTETKRDANAMRASTLYDQNITKKFEDRLDAANRVKILLGNAISGQLIPSENLSQQLATDINVLQNPAGRTTVSGTEHSRPNTLFGKAGAFAHYLSGDPQAAVTQSDLKQMLKETDILYGEIGSQADQKFSNWIKSQPPSLQPALMSRFSDSKNSYFPPGSNLNPQSKGSQTEGGGSPMPGTNALANDQVPKDPDALKYSQMHGMDYSTALGIVSARKAKLNGGQ